MTKMEKLSFLAAEPSRDGYKLSKNEFELILKDHLAD